MATLTFEEARKCVIENAPGSDERRCEWVDLAHAPGRVLAEGALVDRDFPAVSRSIRDGFAVRAADTPGRLRVAGEVRAGEVFNGALRSGEAVEIMTGAPLPEGADSVVMVEHIQRDGEFVTVPAAEPGQFINPRGAEARSGDVAVPRGRRLGIAEIALLASAGYARVRVYGKPVAAILSTGDELVDVTASPAPHQIRNSNAPALAAQVERAGAVARVLPVARDTQAETLSLLEEAFTADAVLISGGVSAGRYDVVEPALASLGARFFFDRVLIQPGQPLVYGAVRGKRFFGLPGNPVSTMVTFELFARALLDRLGGVENPPLPLAWARLAGDFRHKPGLTRFLPAIIEGGEVSPVPWHGSSDLMATAQGNGFLVAERDREGWRAGDFVRVLFR